MQADERKNTPTPFDVGVFSCFILFAIEAIAADELAHDACGRNFVVDVGFVDVVEDFNHCTHLVVTIILGADGVKQWENMALEHRQLVKRGTVEDNVCVLLERENPSLLTATNRIPHCECLLNRCASCFKVAHGAAEQSQITTCNAVVVVEIEGQKRTDVHLKHLAYIQLLGQQNGIERVQAFYDDNRRGAWNRA